MSGVDVLLLKMRPVFIVLLGYVLGNREQF